MKINLLESVTSSCHEAMGFKHDEKQERNQEEQPFYDF